MPLKNSNMLDSFRTVKFFLKTGCSGQVSH
jgi:hypothetical protein